MLSISELLFLKYNHTISWARHNNLLLKLRLPYSCSITPDLSSGLVFQHNLFSMLPTDNIGECKLSLTVMKREKEKEKRQNKKPLSIKKI